MMPKKITVVLFIILYPLVSWSQNIQNYGSKVSGHEVIPPKPIDPQIVQDQDDMTWEDYRPIPGKNWADPSLVPGRKFRMALVAVDFPDQPFVITLPKKSDLFGNPQIDPVKREDVPRVLFGFLA